LDKPFHIRTHFAWYYLLLIPFVIEIYERISAFVVIEIERVDESPNEGYLVFYPLNVGSLETLEPFL
jgi:hypothetical protein